MLFDSRGNSVQLGAKLGRGGEGAVYEASGKPKLAAKVYLSLPDANKQAKLAYMAQNGDARLLQYAAWPQETLHNGRGGPVVGFLMGKVTGKDPMHMVYGPKHRRQKMPNMGWDFLLYVARNTAAAFETLHARGHVLGDVNQGNVMVGGDSQVVLIDTDSYQIRAGNTIHLCEVGVSHFTPPELQGILSFKGVTRTPNHDNFGLALLIFHLLFGGRHPYSGVPLKKGVGDSLEGDIKGYRYAYARDASSRGIGAPPGSISLSLVPDVMRAMFHQAFTERGIQSRPTAGQWAKVLDAQRRQLKRCAVSKTHVYPAHLSSCPWCALERKGIVYFVSLGATVAPVGTGFVLAQVWARINAVSAPAQPHIPDWRAYSPVGRPIPAAAAKEGTTLGVDLFFIFCLVMFVIFPKAWFLWVIGIWIAVANRKPSESPERVAEREARKIAEEKALRIYDDLVNRLKQEAGPDGFATKRRALEKVKAEYEQLAHEEAKELEQLKHTAHMRQKRKFLDGFFIDSADISGVGPARKAALRSFGIETAADVTKNSVMRVRGFGPQLTRAMLDWRASCERRFNYNPRTAITAADINVVKAKYAARRRGLEGVLIAGVSELTTFAQAATVRANLLQAQTEKAARTLAQAKADLAML